MPNIELALVICTPGLDREKIVASALKCGLSPICCSSVAEARTLLPQEDFRMVLCTEALQDGDFRVALREAHRSVPHMPVIVFGLAYDWDSYLKVLGAGAFEYVVCPPNPMEVEKVIWLALADTVGPQRGMHAAA